MIGPGFNGSRVGFVVLFALLGALGYALVVMVLTILGRRVPVGPKWVTFLVPALCIVGMGVASYLTYVETRQVAAICGPVGDCNTVQSSPYAKLFGIVPVGLVGMLGYLLILAAWALAQLREGRLPDMAAVAVFALSLFGVLFSIYLTYLELSIILAICIWCLTSALIMALLLVLTIGWAMDRSGLAVEADF